MAVAVAENPGIVLGFALQLLLHVVGPLGEIGLGSFCLLNRLIFIFFLFLVIFNS